MKKIIKFVFVTFFLLTLVTLLFEFLWVLYFRNELKHGRTGLHKTSHSYKLAMDREDYKTNMEKGAGYRINTVLEKMIYVVFYLILASGILIDSIRLYIFQLSKKSINFYCRSLNNICKNQVALSNIFVFLFLLIYLYDYLDDMFLSKAQNIYLKGLMLLCLYGVICPLSLFAVYFLLQEFGARFIIAIYLALFIYNVYEIFMKDNFSTSRLQRLPPSVFDENVQRYLEKNHLSDKVYQDVNEQKDTNAALVGLDKSARIEIYGDFNNLEPDQKDSILLHEIGHSEDHSLVKKLVIYFLLIYLEMAIMLYLYNSASDHLKCENISKDTSFVLLSLVYFLACKDWLMMFYKLSSQRAEISADLLAKNQGLGKELASTLFNISVTESSFIRPSWLYNALSAMHPSIYDRVEYLFS